MWVQVQATTGTSVVNSAGGIPSATVTFGANVAAGNRVLIASSHYDDTGTTTTPITPTSSGTATMTAWTSLVQNAYAPGLHTCTQTLWTSVVTGSGSLTVTETATATTNTHANELGLTGIEVNGLNTSAGSGCLDQSATATGNNNTTTNIPTGTTGATTGPDQLAIAIAGDWGAGATFTVASGGFTKVTLASRDADGNTSQILATKSSALGATEVAAFSVGGVADFDCGLVAVIKLAPVAHRLSSMVAVKRASSY